MKKSENMTFNSLPVKITVQCILIAIVAFMLLWTINQDYMIITSAGLLVLWILQIGYLIHVTNKSNRDLTRFLQTFQYGESVATFNIDRKDKKLANLYAIFNTILDAFQDVRKNKEADHQLLHNVIEHVGVAVILFDQDGKIQHLNKAFRNLIPESISGHINNLNRIIPGMAEMLEEIKPGKQELYEIKFDQKSAFETENIHKVILDAREFKQEDTTLKLVTLQNIKDQIEQTEINAWEKLIRILNHEIMNSASPINLLSASLIKMFESDGVPKKVSELDDQTIEQALIGLHTIKKRGFGLSQFVESYRNISNMSPPVLVNIQLAQIIRRTIKLLEPDMAEKRITATVEIYPSDLYVRADENYFEQLLINLLKNSVEALTDIQNPKIGINCYASANELIIDISDNGHRIVPDQLEKIFIPFFTSRDEGTGIGLPFVRQVMKLHQWAISVRSDPDKQTVFTLTFRKP
ncbi:MAG: GHKL domain-containing protein [Bacteroidales bacterium]|nr:GHKL domain-containing protein [Bacteroidales bacterium]